MTTMTITIEETRVEALFASPVQRSEHPAADAVRDAVEHTLARHGERGCAALMAREFGEHPETAVPRMRWALAMIRDVYRP
ncbi:hypothetical protein GCM10010123_09180 [Pilimelia anulata]|uniref:Uncharacterized protein n=1 Tax=Pilimelia anulata TaxID=53371 RepID=A0A8J3B865_9ACTN|nr:hypothetical protein [Pilimelia anulata]GGJ81566.1 hypothetical protein GCM10010123_09180 [Pilimelia anulata]